jgi:hypothetical protein
MDSIDERHAVVDLTTLQEVPGAVAADLEAQQVVVDRRNADGTIARATLHYPAGIRLVRRR